MNKINFNSAIKIATIAGASVLAVNSVMRIIRSGSPKDAIMPAVSLLVSVAAFQYAMKSSAPVVTEKK